MHEVQDGYEETFDEDEVLGLRLLSLGRLAFLAEQSRLFHL